METTVDTIDATDRSDTELAAVITGLVAQRLATTDKTETPAHKCDTDELVILSWMIAGELTPLLDPAHQRDGVLHLQPDVYTTLFDCKNKLTGPGRDLRVVTRKVLATTQALRAR
ncbi:MAG: hypothetical protein L0H59_05235 [Tomitella sp.]|nr:hypothetical protein [Tomitella sp.]